MSGGRYIVGILGLAILAGGPLLCGLALRRRHLAGWHGAPARLAEAVMAIGVQVGLLELLGTLHLFRAGWIVAGSVGLGLAGLVVLRRLGIAAVPPAPPPPAPPLAASAPPPAAPAPALSPTASAIETAVAILAAVAVLAAWLVPTLDSLRHGIRTFDSLWYHLPWAASFAHTGDITSLRFTDVEYLTAFYPATAELFHGAGLAVLGRDTFSTLLNLVWLALELLAAWCVGARRGLGPLTLMAVACVLGTPMMVLSQAGSAANDIVGIFFLTSALALMLHATEGEAAPLVLAALGCGLAVDTKLSLLVPAGGLWIGLLARTRFQPRGGRNAALPLVAAFVAGGAFWYLRNLLAVGNPLPWLRLPGLAHPAPPLQDATGLTVAHYLTSGRFWVKFGAPGLHAGLGWGWPGLVLLAILAPALLLATRRRTDPRMALVGGVALTALAGYLLTPESAAGPPGDPAGFAFNLRYAAPALVLCIASAALVPDRLGPSAAARARPLMAGLLVALLTASLGAGRLWPSRDLPAAPLAALLSAIAIAAIWWTSVRRPRAGAALACAVALLCALGGMGVQRRYLRGRYRPVPGVSQLTPVWARFRTVHRQRVALVGTFGGFFGYPLWGADDSDPVTYVAHRGPHGSFTPIHTCREWRSTLNSGHYTLLVATPARDPWHPRHLAPSPEAGWTRGSPAATLLLRHSGAGATIYVFRLHGRLDPAACG